jgi:hypothetical protein
MALKFWLLAASLSLAACGGSETPEPPPEPAAEERRPSVLDPLTSTIGRAEGVQQTVDEQAAQQRRRIEEAEE